MKLHDSKVTFFSVLRQLSGILKQCLRLGSAIDRKVKIAQYVSDVCPATDGAYVVEPGRQPRVATVLTETAMLPLYDGVWRVLVGWRYIYGQMRRANSHADISRDMARK